MITLADAVANAPRYQPRYGWHDDHRVNERTAHYLPALQQVRSEFAEFLETGLPPVDQRHKALQLGMGECTASHYVWLSIFKHAVTISWGASAIDSNIYPAMDTHDIVARDFAERCGPYDLLFIDAGHALYDVKRDWLDYGAMVRPGGTIAFHDALPRAGYPEVEVWRFIETLSDVTIIGGEVGIAWTRR